MCVWGGSIGVCIIQAPSSYTLPAPSTTDRIPIYPHILPMRPIEDSLTSIPTHPIQSKQMETCNAWDIPHNADQEKCVAALGKGPGSKL